MPRSREVILSREQAKRLMILLDRTIDVQDSELEAGRWRSIRNKVAVAGGFPQRKPGSGYAYAHPADEDPRQTKIPGS